MKTLWKGAAAALIAATAMFAAAPAQAQYYGDGYGHRYERDWRDDRRSDRWDRRDRYDRDRRHYYRGENRDHRYWRKKFRHNDRCWTEWRYSHRYHERIRVRRCR